MKRSSRRKQNGFRLDLRKTVATALLLVSMLNFGALYFDVLSWGRDRRQADEAAVLAPGSEQPAPPSGSAKGCAALAGEDKDACVEEREARIALRRKKEAKVRKDEAALEEYKRRRREQKAQKVAEQAQEQSRQQAQLDQEEAAEKETRSAAHMAQAQQLKEEEELQLAGAEDMTESEKIMWRLKKKLGPPGPPLPAGVGGEYILYNTTSPLYSPCETHRGRAVEAPGSADSGTAAGSAQTQGGEQAAPEERHLPSQDAAGRGEMQDAAGRGMARQGTEAPHTDAGASLQRPPPLGKRVDNSSSAGHMGEEDEGVETDIYEDDMGEEDEGAEADTYERRPGTREDGGDTEHKEVHRQLMQHLLQYDEQQVTDASGWGDILEDTAEYADDAESGGMDGDDAESGGMDGKDAESGGMDGKDAESGGMDGNDDAEFSAVSGSDTSHAAAVAAVGNSDRGQGVIPGDRHGGNADSDLPQADGHSAVGSQEWSGIPGEGSHVSGGQVEWVHSRGDMSGVGLTKKEHGHLSKKKSVYRSVKYHHAVSLALLPSGAVLAVWQAATLIEGEGDQHLRAAVSTDEGRTWPVSWVLLGGDKHKAGGALWSPVVHVDSSGKVWVFYAESEGDCIRNMRPNPRWPPGGSIKAITATDSLVTRDTAWSRPHSVWSIYDGSFIPKLIASKLLVLSTGEWVLPYWSENTALAATKWPEALKHCRTKLNPAGQPWTNLAEPSAGVLVSADGGATWQARGEIKNTVVPGNEDAWGVGIKTTTLSDSSVVERRNGDLAMYFRTHDTGFMFHALSTNQGFDWTQATATSVQIPDSPFQVWRGQAEGGGRAGPLLLAFNDHRRDAWTQHGREARLPEKCRTQLTLAASHDEGASWTRIGVVRGGTAPGLRYQNPSILQLGCHLLVGYSKMYVSGFKQRYEETHFSLRVSQVHLVANAKPSLKVCVGRWKPQDTWLYMCPHSIHDKRSKHRGEEEEEEEEEEEQEQEQEQEGQLGGPIAMSGLRDGLVVGAAELTEGATDSEAGNDNIGAPIQTKPRGWMVEED